MVVTAGDLIRRELAEGASELGLAKRLAGSPDDANAEVKRWRYVVRRAAAGGEPGAANMARIMRLLRRDGDEVSETARRRSVLDRFEGRLEELADAQAQILENQVKGTAALAAQLRALQRRLDSLVEVERTVPRRSRRSQ